MTLKILGVGNYPPPPVSATVLKNLIPISLMLLSYGISHNYELRSALFIPWNFMRPLYENVQYYHTLKWSEKHCEWGHYFEHLLNSWILSAKNKSLHMQLFFVKLFLHFNPHVLESKFSTKASNFTMVWYFTYPIKNHIKCSV